MNEEQKKLLQEQTLVVIQQILPKESLEVLDTVRFAKSHDFFFPEMYQLWFRAKVAQTYFTDNCASVLKCRKIFGVDTGQASKIYHSITGDNIDKIRNPARRNEADLYVKNLTSALNTGIFLEAGVIDYLEKIYKSLADIDLTKIKSINQKNLSLWIEGELEEKAVDTPKMKI